MIRRYAVLLIALALVAGLVPAIGEPDRSTAAPFAIGRVHDSYDPTSGKIFVLVIGSDARSGNPNLHADAIHLVGINTDTMRGGILNFPRDSWVSVPGFGATKINNALLRGPQNLAVTIESITGIRIDYWVMTGFEGFTDIVNSVGPIPIRIPSSVYDPRGSGARIAAGKRKLVGGSALAYVRTRKVFGGGDVTRTHNQGRFLKAMLRELRRDVSRNPASVLKWIAAGREFTRAGMSQKEAFRLGILATRLKSKKVGNVTVPVRVGAVGAASVVFISPSANSLFARFRTNASL